MLVLGIHVRNECSRYARSIALEHAIPLNTVESVIKMYLTRMGTGGLAGFEVSGNDIRNSGKTYIDEIAQDLNLHRTSTELIIRDYLKAVSSHFYRDRPNRTGYLYEELILDGVCRVRLEWLEGEDYPQVRGRVEESFRSRLAQAIKERKERDARPFRYEERVVIDGICTVTILVDSSLDEPIVRGRVSAAFKERIYAAV